MPGTNARGIDRDATAANSTEPRRTDEVSGVREILVDWSLIDEQKAAAANEQVAFDAPFATILPLARRRPPVNVEAARRSDSAFRF